MTDILHENSEGDALKIVPDSKYITERTPKQEDGVRFLGGDQRTPTAFQRHILHIIKQSNSLHETPTQ